MSNVLSKDKQIAVMAALAEGSSVRSIERMNGIHRDTIMRLGIRIGQGCAKLLDQKMRGLDSRSLQVDEIWGVVGKGEETDGRRQSVSVGFDLDVLRDRFISASICLAGQPAFI